MMSAACSKYFRNLISNRVLILFVLAASFLISSATYGQTTYWLGRKTDDGSLVYDMQVPEFFAEWMKQPTPPGGGTSFTRTINGKEYKFYKQYFKWFNGGAHPGTGQIALWNDETGFALDWKYNVELKSDANAGLRAELNKQAGSGDWVQISGLTVMEVDGAAPPDMGGESTSGSGNSFSLSGPFDSGSAPSEQRGMSSQNPRIIAVPNGNSLVIAWQEFTQGKPTAAKVTQFDRSNSGYTKSWEKTLPLDRLGGLTTDGTNYFVLSAKAENLSRDSSAVSYRANILKLTKYDGNGNVIWDKDVNNAEYLGDVGADGKASTAVFSPMTGGTAGLAYGNGQVLVVLASNTLPDGNFRHQRSQFFVVSASDGSGSKSRSETSWRHSFDQRVIFDGTDFVIMDLGDAGWYMPAAGITVRKVKKNSSGGADFVPNVAEGVYIYARQSETAGSQNFTFTSMGDIRKGRNGYVALFTSERDNNITNRSGWDVPIAQPRNLAMVHVTSNFETVKDAKHYSNNNPDGNPSAGNVDVDWRKGQPVKINITSNIVDSRGASSNFTRPNDPSKTVSTTGVVWLTDLANGVSAERPKLVAMGDGTYIALWEQWTYSGTTISYQSTHAMRIDESGQQQGQTRSIDARLNPNGADQAFEVGGTANWIAGDESGGKFILYSIDSNLNVTRTELSL